MQKPTEINVSVEYQCPKCEWYICFHKDAIENPDFQSINCPSCGVSYKIQKPTLNISLKESKVRPSKPPQSAGGPDSDTVKTLKEAGYNKKESQKILQEAKKRGISDIEEIFTKVIPHVSITSSNI